MASAHVETGRKKLLERQRVHAERKAEENGIPDDKSGTEDSEEEINVIEKFKNQKHKEIAEANRHRLERKHKREKRLNKMEGVERYKLRQRTHGRKEVRTARWRLKHAEQNITLGEDETEEQKRNSDDEPIGLSEESPQARKVMSKKGRTIDDNQNLALERFSERGFLSQQKERRK